MKDKKRKRRAEDSRLQAGLAEEEANWKIIQAVSAQLSKPATKIHSVDMHVANKDDHRFDHVVSFIIDNILINGCTVALVARLTNNIYREGIFMLMIGRSYEPLMDRMRAEMRIARETRHESLDIQVIGPVSEHWRTEGVKKLYSRLESLPVRPPIFKTTAVVA